jgi:hypothetical protein
LIPCADDDERAIAGVGELRTLLTGSRTTVKAATTSRAVSAEAAVT